MTTITEITLNQINSALLSLKRDNENLYKLVFDLKTSIAELKSDVEKLEQTEQITALNETKPEITGQSEE
jgi:hypothetical protein